MTTDWRDNIKVGDILATKQGKLRIVRYVSFHRGKLFFVKFSIKRCSWTKRCYTLVSRYEIAYRGMTPTGHNKPLTSKLDKAIAKCIYNSNDRSLSCCDVENVS